MELTNWIDIGISLTFEHIVLLVSVYTDVIIHDHCPLDYCLTTENNSLSFSLESPDDQCAFRRSGFFVDHVQEISVKYLERQGAENVQIFTLSHFFLVLSLQD